MKEIQLTQGVVALVDDGDFEELNKYKWHAQLHHDHHTWYARRALWNNGKEFYMPMHRQIMSTPKGMVTDHIVHRPFEERVVDNRRSNLRICSQTQNRCNRRVRSDCKSGVTGVHWCSIKNRWVAKIMEPKELIQLGRVAIELPPSRITLGRFKNFDDAVRARREAEKKYYGDFAPKY